jgi:hypothetical protein
VKFAKEYYNSNANGIVLVSIHPLKLHARAAVKKFQKKSENILKVLPYIAYLRVQDWNTRHVPVAKRDLQKIQAVRLQ